MKFVFAPLAAAVLFVTSALAQQLTINTPLAINPQFNPHPLTFVAVRIP